MIKHKNITYDFSLCTDKEKEILEEYWNWDDNSDFNFKMNLSDISLKYDYTISRLYKLASDYSLIWRSTCTNEGCDNPIEIKISKRKELCNQIDGFFTRTTCYYNSECKGIKKESFNPFGTDSFEDNPFSSFQEGFIDDEQQELKSIYDEEIIKSIKNLEPTQIKILYQIYDIGDFTLIKSSSEVFPVRHGEYYSFVWKTIYNFNTLGLIEAQLVGNFVKDIFFLKNVEEILNRMVTELEPYIERTTIELALLKIKSADKTKYFSVLEPETDIILKAGNKYEFLASPLNDNNLFLKIINIDTLKT